jgi:DNA-binding CsgD family transcriptional regulator
LDAEARWLASRGEHRRALERWSAIDQFEKDFGMQNPCYVIWREAAVNCLLSLGDRGEAQRLAAEDLARARRFGATRPLAIALRGVAAASLNPEPAANESLALLERTAARLDLAKTLLAVGKLLRPRDRNIGIQHLSRAMTIAHDCGALVLADQAREALRAAGMRPRTLTTRGRHALTTSERRIASLAARGHTNRQIAQAQCVTVKTVSYHLTNIYRKLGISARGQLRSALAGDQDAA